MATNQRQSLRALQERLAVRLADAKKSGAEAAWLAVEASGQRYLLPLVHSGEIFPLPVIQAVPYTQGWFLGVAALRGGLMAVVDLAGLLSQGQARSKALRTNAETKLIALNTALGLNAALLVDRLVGLRSASAFVGASPRAEGTLPVLSQQLTDVNGVQWQELSLQALVEWPDFLSVVA